MALRRYLRLHLYMHRFFNTRNSLPYLTCYCAQLTIFLTEKRPDTSQIELDPLKMPPNSRHLCIFSANVTLCTVFPCLAATSVIRGHNVFSVLLYQMSLKTFFMTHTTYTPSSAWKYHLHAHNTALSKTIAPGNWGILTRSKAKTNLGNEYFPQYLGPHP